MCIHTYIYIYIYIDDKLQKLRAAKVKITCILRKEIAIAYVLHNMDDIPLPDIPDVN